MTNPFPAPCCAGYERRFSAKKPSVLHADGLNKVSQMHLPPPSLPRFGGGERPPFLCKPIAPLTITMGQRLGSLQALTTPRALLSVYSCQPIRAPFPPSGKGVGGKGRYARGYLGSDSVRSTDLFFPIIEGKTNPYPAQPATGVLGQSPKRILPTFVRTKVGPRRAGVLIRICKRFSPPQAPTNYFTNAPAASRTNQDF